jgi:solute carrier family 25 phosphate transporter 23/24/25/41
MSKKEESRVYMGFSDCIKKMVKNEGITSLYKGYAISTIGMAPYLAIAFSTYDTLKAMIPVAPS